jgi:chemotaxis protein MotB
MLNDVPNKVSLSGHTDAAAYVSRGKGYSNWELSADRANASRRELISGGMADEKIVRVVGLSSAVLFNKEDPLNPVNRRISMIVMNKKAEEAAQHDGGIVKTDGSPDNEESGAPLGLGAVSGVLAVPVPDVIPVPDVVPAPVPAAR